MDASVHFKLNYMYVKLITVFFIVIACRQLLFNVDVTKLNHVKLSYCTFNNTSDV